jgi:hypothetical protein
MDCGAWPQVFWKLSHQPAKILTEFQIQISCYYSLFFHFYSTVKLTSFTTEKLQAKNSILRSVWITCWLHDIRLLIMKKYIL